MYRPQTYHHIQEIQKYNIQDYRPRYAIFPCSLIGNPRLTLFSEWNNSRKPSGKYVKYRGCENNVDMRFRKQMKVKRASLTRMILRGIVADMEKCQSRQRGDDNVHVYEV
jgi:phospholipid-transporting ATPase